MIGVNELVLNQASMQIVVEYYLNNVVFKDSQKVVVKGLEKIHSNMLNEYKIRFEPIVSESPEQGRD